MAPTILAYQAMTPDAIGEDELPEAVALNSVAINLARAVGPALAGLLIVALSAGALFAIESAAILLIMVVVFRLRVPSERPESPEPLMEALRAGARYVRFFGPARTTLIRTALFAGCASALWALLPVVALGPLDLDSRGLGLLMGCVGTGALCGATVMPRVRGAARLRPHDRARLAGAGGRARGARPDPRARGRGSGAALHRGLAGSPCCRRSTRRRSGRRPAGCARERSPASSS